MATKKLSKSEIKKESVLSRPQMRGCLFGWERCGYDDAVVAFFVLLFSMSA